MYIFGDKVVCIDNSFCSDLTVGKEYEVISSIGFLITIIDDSNDEYNYDINRFEPVEINVGDKVVCIDTKGFGDFTDDTKYEVIHINGSIITVFDNNNSEQYVDINRFKKSCKKENKMFTVETTDYSNYESSNIETTNTDIPVPEKVKDVGVTVDNGRIYVTINGVEVYSNMSLHYGNVTINC